MRLDNVAEAGRLKGRPAVLLELVALTFGGFNYPTRSLLFEQQGLSRGNAARSSSEAARQSAQSSAESSVTAKGRP